jgi:hypothetical protein
MEILIAVIAIAFIFGLLTRSKGDGFLDTLSSGCVTVVVIILVLVALVYFSMAR